MCDKAILEYGGKFVYSYKNKKMCDKAVSCL